MNNRILPYTCITLLAALFIAACDVYVDAADIKKFDKDLRGTWVSNDPSVYSGTLRIEFDRITISGFAEGQTPQRNDDSRRPFKSFTKNVSLNGYSEDGKIFIEDGGSTQDGIPYTYYTAGAYPQKQFLHVNFGGRQETMQKKADPE
jgi:hypothetical protein